MLNSVTLHIPSIPCYDNPVEISDLKKINIFYGLNGVGKTTFSQYFQSLKTPKDIYQQCSPNTLEEFEVLVFNGDFRETEFLQKNEGLSTIVTLSKPNVNTTNAIEEKKKELQGLEEDENNENCIKSLEKQCAAKNAELTALEDRTKNNVWKAKDKNFQTTASQTAFRNMVSGTGNSKELFLNRVKQTQVIEPFESLTLDESIQKVVKEYQELSSNQSPKKDDYALLSTLFDDIKTDEHFQLLKTPLLGSENSFLKETIQTFNHPDWLAEGLTNYLQATDSNQCPFCTQAIEEELKSKLLAHLDASYKETQTKIKTLEKRYQEYFDLVSTELTILKSYSFINKDKVTSLESLLEKNSGRLKTKIKEPSRSISLEDTDTLVNELNEQIKKESTQNKAFNEALKNKIEIQTKLKNQLWGLLKKEHEKTFHDYNTKQTELNQEKTLLENQKKECNTRIATLKTEIKNLEQQMEDLETAVNNINANLLNIGMTGFQLKHTAKGRYEIIRDGTDSNTPANYKTLSEGEKTIITFLYFLEKCKERSTKSKIVVIDDPISSLSFQAVFDVSRLIHQCFIKGKQLHTSYKQLFILTHHLVFYTELIRAKVNQKDNTAYYRITKSDNKTEFHLLEKDSIKNHYEALWEILKDYKQNIDSVTSKESLVIPNIMRQILETFTGVYYKNDKLENLKLPESTLYGLGRYLDTGSHHDRILQGIEPLDVTVFFTDFEEFFELNRHTEHYNCMMGITSDREKLEALLNN